jgi:hypothetical protein
MAPHEINRPFGEQIRQVPFSEDLLVALPEIVSTETGVPEEIRLSTRFSG